MRSSFLASLPLVALVGTTLASNNIDEHQKLETQDIAQLHGETHVEVGQQQPTKGQFEQAFQDLGQVPNGAGHQSPAEKQGSKKEQIGQQHEGGHVKTHTGDHVELGTPVTFHDCPKHKDTKAAFAKGLGYISPFDLGGNMSFSFVDPERPDLKPEPINTIISANSWFGSFTGGNNTEIFLRSRGFAQYLSALNLSDECGGLHFSNDAFARVNGPKPELLNFLYRENFGDWQWGSCDQTPDGGLKFRGWRQNNTGAFFLAPAISQDLEHNHAPTANGYDDGRDEVVRRAKLGGVDHLGCVWPPAKIEKEACLVQPDAGGPNGLYNHGVGIDGIVSVITIGKPVCPGDRNSTNSTWAGKPHYLAPVNPLSPAMPDDGGAGVNGAGSSGEAGVSGETTKNGKSGVKPSTGSSMPSAALTVGSLFAGFLVAVLAL